MGQGDRLASGNKSAVFSTGGKSVTQKQWDKMFPPTKKKSKGKKRGR